MASNPVTPATVPGAPTIGTATAGNAQATLTFTAPTTTGGSPITGYTVTSSPGGLNATGTASPLTVTGLTNGTAYTFTVVATNAKGNSAASAASNSVTPVGVPGVPTVGTAAAGNAQATLTFTAPTTTGGSVITSYTVTSSPGGLTATGAASPVTVTGLTNGTAYTFTVVATNAIGSSVASAASNSVTPATVPGAPTIGTATAGNAQATVSFTAPASNGGSAVTGYTVTASPGGLTATGTTSPLTVTGLTNGTAYTFTVKATNAIGSGADSLASNAVTPGTVPTAPIIGTATAGNGEATVSFTAPSDTGGSAITGYTVTSSPDGLAVNGGGSPLTVSGLTNGTTYTFTVVATNTFGNSLASAPSNPVTPSGNLNVYFVHPDHLGTPRQVTDSQGTPVWTWDNTEPFGDSAPNPNPSSTGNFTFNLRFPGQYFDAETGLHYNYFRDYDPKSGRYVESDPIGLAGGFNSYAYVDSNSVSLADPYGLTPRGTAYGAAIGASVTAAASVAADAMTGGANILATPGEIATAAAIGAAIGNTISNVIDTTNTSTVNENADIGKNCPPDGKDPCQGIRDQLRKHEKKLKDYITDPYSNDNKDLLGKGRDEAVIAGRIRNLQNQIENFKKLLEECERQHGK